MKIRINQQQYRIGWLEVGYIVVILAFIGLVTRNLNYNTAFVDEAIYATVGEEFLRGTTWEDAISWMAGSYGYPVISAYLNRWGGLELVRLFSVFCLLTSGLVAGYLGKQVGGKVAGFIAMGMFLFSSNVLNMSILGTYDAPGILMLGLSTVMMVKAAYGKSWSWFWVISSALSIAGAILFKYVAIFWVPVLGLFLLLSSKWGWLKAVVWGLIILVSLAPYVWLNQEDLISYLNGSYSLEFTTRLRILKDLGSYLGIYLAGSGIALLLLWRKSSWKYRNWMMFLLLGGLIPLSYHLGTANIRSFWKHLGYATMYLSPLAAWGVVELNRIYQDRERYLAWTQNLVQLWWSVVIVGLVAGMWVNLSDHWRFQRSWPSYNLTIAYLDDRMVEGDRVFAEASSVLKYHLYRGFSEPHAWASTWYMQYEGVDGLPAMEAAIEDEVFAYVILNGYFTPDVNRQLMDELEANYELVLEEPYKLSGLYDTKTTVWARRGEELPSGFFKLFVPQDVLLGDRIQNTEIRRNTEQQDEIQVLSKQETGDRRAAELQGDRRNTGVQEFSSQNSGFRALIAQAN